MEKERVLHTTILAKKNGYSLDATNCSAEIAEWNVKVRFQDNW